MRRVICVILMVAGLFLVFCIAFAINNFCATMVFLFVATCLAILLTREPWSMPDPYEQEETLSSVSTNEAAEQVRTRQLYEKL